MLYIGSKIDYPLLIDWIDTWDEEKYLSFLNEHYGDHKFQFDDSFKKDIQNAKEVSKELKEQFDLRLLSRSLIECFFKFDSVSMKIANVFETIILPSDIATKKRMFKGFDNNYSETGNFSLISGEKTIGNIGRVSDWYFTVFYTNFIKVKKWNEAEKEEFSEIVHANIIDNYLSIKIWAPEIKDHNNTIEQILYVLSKEHDLKFKRASFSPLQMTEGDVIYGDIKLPQRNIEQTPLLFYNSANYSTVPRLRFLSYYQSIEYYFVRANNVMLQKNLIDASVSDLDSIDYQKVNAAINKYQNGKREKEALKLVLKKAISKDTFIENLSENQIDYYTKGNNQLSNLDFSTNTTFYTTLSNRIYSVRCSIVHSKGDTEQECYLPNIDEEIIDLEIPLIKKISECVLEAWNA